MDEAGGLAVKQDSRTSEYQLEWFVRMTGPDAAAERSVLNDGDVRKYSIQSKSRGDGKPSQMKPASM